MPKAEKGSSSGAGRKGKVSPAQADAPAAGSSSADVTMETADPAAEVPSARARATADACRLQ